MSRAVLNAIRGGCIGAVVGMVGPRIGLPWWETCLVLFASIVAVNLTDELHAGDTEDALSRAKILLRVHGDDIIRVVRAANRRKGRPGSAS